MLDTPRSKRCPSCGSELAKASMSSAVMDRSKVFGRGDVSGHVCTQCGTQVLAQQAADRDDDEDVRWLRQATAKKLAALGGSMPDIEPIPRRRLEVEPDA